MNRRRHPAREPARDDVDAALATMSADQLREVVRGMLLELDDKAHCRVMNSLIHRAARGSSGWAPAALSEGEVAHVLAFAKAAARVGRADPSEVDEYLRLGSSAFLRRDYAAAHRIFGALLRPIGEADIDLGQHELVDEVLGVDTGGSAAQHVVSVYMLSPSAERADAVRAAINEVRGVRNFWEPIREMERVAVEPLPELDDFLRRWRALIARKSVDARGSDSDTEQDRWLREVVQRLEGSDGLAKVARSTRRADDLRAWCRSLVDCGDWKAALPAFAEAAGLVTDKDYVRGELLDGAALAAQELGREDLPKWLEGAWRADPTMLRLRRWLGSAGRNAALRKHAAEALDACPEQAARQRAFLLVLQNDFEPAAKLLAAAPSLGWSHGEHPGHLLFPLFAGLLGGKQRPLSPSAKLLSHRWVDIEELELTASDRNEPRLATPEVEQILRTAEDTGVPKAGARGAIVAAMRKAAERRLAAITDQKRRRHYGHAAELVAVCVACDPSPQTARWVASIRTEYRRFPALRDELNRALGSP